MKHSALPLLSPDLQAWVERIDERTRTARVWQNLENPARRYCVVRMGTHCFASPGSQVLDEVIDYRLAWDGRAYHPRASPFPVSIQRTGEHVSIGGLDLNLRDFGSMREGRWTALLPITSERLYITPRCAPYKIAPTYHASYLEGEVAAGVKFRAAISAKGYGKELRFAPLVQSTWFSRLADAEFFGFRYRKRGTLDARWNLTPPRMFVRRRGGQADGFYREDGEDFYILFPRYQLDRLLPGEWIVDPAITQESIVANSDDCYDYQGSNNLDGFNGMNYLGRLAGATINVGLRFQSIPIPATATGINSASLQLYRELNVAGTPVVTWYADDQDDAPTWETGTSAQRPDGAGVTRTAASALWNSDFGAADAYVTTPSLAAIVDEVIQRAGWASGNDMRFVAIGAGTGDSFAPVNDFSNNSTTEEALFDADYIAGSSDPLPAAGTLALTGAAPLVTQGLVIAALAGSLALSGAAPVVATVGILQPAAGALAFTGNAPVITLQSAISPASASLALTGSAPIVIGIGRITPPAGTLALAGSAALITQQFNRVPAAGALAFNSSAPQLVVPGIGPATGSLLITGGVPQQTLTVPPPVAGELALTGFAPQVAQSGNFLRTPLAGALAIGGVTPLIRQGTYRTPGSGALALTGLLSQGTIPVIIAPGAGTLALTGVAPATGGSLSFTIQSAAPLALTGFAPRLEIAHTLPLTLTPPSGALVLSTFNPQFGGYSVHWLWHRHR